MKYLLVLMVVSVAIWIWRKNRAEADAERRAERLAKAAAQAAANRKTSAPQPMIVCRHCGTHLAQADATQGKLGWYCDRAHRQLSEGQ